jgi:hypothetical protein
MQVQAGDYNYEVVKQGYAISSEMKIDAIELYFQSLFQREFKNQSDYIRSNLDAKFGSSCPKLNLI